MMNYPFLDKNRQFIPKDNKLIYIPQSFTFLKQILKNETYLEEFDSDIIDVNIFFNCCVILNQLNEKYITKKFIQNYCKRIEYFLLHDYTQEVFEYLQIRYEIVDKNLISLDLIEFLKIRASEVRMSQQPKIRNGIVIMERKTFIFCVRRLLEDNLMNKIVNMKPVEKLIHDDNKMEEIRQTFAPAFLNITKMKLPMLDNPKQIPPCIFHILKTLDETYYLTHNERWLLAVYMLKRGFDLDKDIIPVYEKLSDYKEEKTKYHIKSLEGYLVPMCESVESMGLCFNDHGRCSKIKTPLFY